jgi:DNA-directed RNA polymerase subunit omega
MSSAHDTMMSPPIENLLETGGSKFDLVALSSTRAREINAYFNQLGEGLGAVVPPQVTSVARKPLSIAFEEIGAGKILPKDPEAEEPEGTEAAEGDGAEAPAIAAVPAEGE